MMHNIAASTEASWREPNCPSFEMAAKRLKRGLTWLGIWSPTTELPLSYCWATTELTLSHCCATTELLLSYHWANAELVLSYHWANAELLLSYHWANAEVLLSYHWANAELPLSQCWATVELPLTVFCLGRFCRARRPAPFWWRPAFLKKSRNDALPFLPKKKK